MPPLTFHKLIFNFISKNSSLWKKSHKLKDLYLVFIKAYPKIVGAFNIGVDNLARHLARFFNLLL